MITRWTRRHRQAAIWGSSIRYLFICTLVTACERSPVPAPDPAIFREGFSIAMVGPGETHPQWPGVRGGALRYAAAVPSVRMQFANPSDSTADSLRQALTAVLAHQPRAVCLYLAKPSLADVGGLRANLKMIAREQILIVTMGERFQDTHVYGYVGADLPGAAERLGDNLPRVAAGRRSYLLLHDSGVTPLATACYQRFGSAMRRQRELTLLQERNAAEGKRSPVEIVEEMMKLFPNAGLLVTLDPDVWLDAPPGWTVKLREINRGFRFVTLSASPQLWPWLGTPAVPGDAAALVEPLDGEIGFAAVEIAVRALASERQSSPTRWIECEVVRPDNLADFARRYSAAANGLDVSAYLRGTIDVSTQPAGN